MSETAVQIASRAVREAEQRQDRQIGLIAGLAGRGEACGAAEEILREIKRTLRLAQAHLALLRSLDD